MESCFTNFLSEQLGEKHMFIHISLTAVFSLFKIKDNLFHDLQSH